MASQKLPVFERWSPASADGERRLLGYTVKIRKAGKPTIQRQFDDKDAAEGFALATLAAMKNKTGQFEEGKRLYPSVGQALLIYQDTEAAKAKKSHKGEVATRCLPARQGWRAVARCHHFLESRCAHHRRAARPRILKFISGMTYFIMADRKIHDERHVIARRRGNGELRREIWVDKAGRVTRYNLAYINHSLYQGDNGRVVGYDNAHGYHHRHHFGVVASVDFVSFEDIEEQFERDWTALRAKS